MKKYKFDLNINLVTKDLEVYADTEEQARGIILKEDINKLIAVSKQTVELTYKGYDESVEIDRMPKKCIMLAATVEKATEDIKKLTDPNIIPNSFNLQWSDKWNCYVVTFKRINKEIKEDNRDIDLKGIVITSDNKLVAE